MDEVKVVGAPEPVVVYGIVHEEMDVFGDFGGLDGGEIRADDLSLWKDGGLMGVSLYSGRSGQEGKKRLTHLYGPDSRARADVKDPLRVLYRGKE